MHSQAEHGNTKLRLSVGPVPPPGSSALTSAPDATGRRCYNNTPPVGPVSPPGSPALISAPDATGRRCYNNAPSCGTGVPTGKLCPGIRAGRDGTGRDGTSLLQQRPSCGTGVPTGKLCPGIRAGRDGTSLLQRVVTPPQPGRPYLPASFYGHPSASWPATYPWFRRYRHRLQPPAVPACACLAPWWFHAAGAGSSHPVP